MVYLCYDAKETGPGGIAGLGDVCGKKDEWKQSITELQSTVVVTSIVILMTSSPDPKVIHYSLVSQFSDCCS